MTDEGYRARRARLLRSMSKHEMLVRLVAAAELMERMRGTMERAEVSLKDPERVRERVQYAYGYGMLRATVEGAITELEYLTQGLTEGLKGEHNGQP